MERCERGCEVSNKDQKGPLTSGNKPKRDRWYRPAGANEAAGSDAQFEQLSRRFWGFARQVGFAGGERTLSDVLMDLWRAKVFLLVGALVGCLLAVAFIGVTIPQTRVHMLIAPANPLNDSGGSLLDDKNFAVLRFIAQRTGVDNSSGFARFENIYDGVSVARLLMGDPKIVAAVLTDRRFKFLMERDGLTPEKLADYIGRKVRLESVGASSTRALEYWHANAATGKYFITQLHAVTDELIRDSVQVAATERVGYLNAKILEARHPEHRRSLTELLLEQERLLMLASIDQPYAASVIEPAAKYYKPQWPDTFLLLAVFGIVGAFIGFVLYGMHYARYD